MADILKKLPLFFRVQMNLPFYWGVSDCGLYLADWSVFLLGGEDPAAALRGTYSDQTGAAAALGDDGFTAFVDHLAISKGFVPTEEPQNGAIGVIDMPAGLTGAVMSNGSWVFKTARGLVWAKTTPGKLVKAWAPPDA